MTFDISVRNFLARPLSDIVNVSEVTAIALIEQRKASHPEKRKYYTVFARATGLTAKQAALLHTSLIFIVRIRCPVRLWKSFSVMRTPDAHSRWSPGPQVT